LEFSFFSFWVDRIKDSFRIASLCAMAGLWVLLEWTRLFFLCGFTWNPVGLFLSNWHQGAQLAAFFGVFGLSFWVMFTNLLFLRIRTAAQGIAWCAAAGFPYLFGFLYPMLVSSVDEGSLEVA